MTKKNKHIIQPYFKMLSWNDKKLENVSFEKLVLKGIVYKKKEKFTIFTSQFCSRFITFDLTKAMMSIKHNEKDHINLKTNKNIPFRDIEVVQIINDKPVKEAPKHFTYEFCLKTHERVFQLYSSTP